MGRRSAPEDVLPLEPKVTASTRGTSRELREALLRIDGRGYGAYKEIKGRWTLGSWTLEVAWIQGDPYAAPSRLRAHLPADVVGLPPETLRSRSRRIGVACHLARAFCRAARSVEDGPGSGRSGEIRMVDPGQQVFEQTAVQVAQDGSVEARFGVGLPARGRRILGERAADLLVEEVAGLVEDALLASAHPGEALVEAAEVNEDADHLRERLADLDLLAFVADGARLPRRSGIDERPLEGEGVVPFRTPPTLSVEVDLPNRGRVTGMGLPRGVVLVVGGGFHGKSTLLRAVELGVYNHPPGDGRERVVSEPGAVKVRAEDGRAVSGVDISPFIDGLPGEADTHAFATPNASGSTSQAAAIVEAVEAGASSLLVDEDTAATNFMIRDRRMQALVPAGSEPITPFVDRVREMYEEHGIASVLVLGGSGDYLEAADTVVAMRGYLPHDVTERAREVARDHPTGRRAEATRPLVFDSARRPVPDSVDPSRGRRSVSVKVRDTDRLLFGTEEIDLSAVEQLVSAAQLRSVARALDLAREAMDGRRTLAEVLDAVEERVAGEGLDVLDDRRPGDLCHFRRFELAATLNRLRTLRVETG